MGGRAADLRMRVRKSIAVDAADFTWAEDVKGSILSVVGQKESQSIKSVVIFLPPTLGDSVHHTATLGWLRAAWPDAKIVAVTGALGLELIRACGIADEVWDRKDGQVKLFMRLLKGRFDLAIFSYVQNKQLRMAKAAGVRKIIGIKGSKHDNWLDVALVKDLGVHQITGGVRALLESIGVEPDELNYVIPRPESAIQRVASDLESGEWAAVMVGASHPNKEWPLEKFQAVAQWLKEQGLKIVAVGGPREAGRLGELADLDVAGRYSALETAELLRRCKILVTNDTGVMHIAGAVGCPLVGLFGPASPDHFRPPGTRVAFHGGYCDCAARTPETCQRKCMDVSVDEVIESCTALMGEKL